MDREKVAQIAREQKDIAQGRHLRDAPDTEEARRQETHALERLWEQVVRESTEYCACYNDAYGIQRIRTEAHADTVVIRSLLDQEDTLVFRRTLPSSVQAGHVEVHRYQYPTRPVDLPVALKHTPEGLALTYRGQDIAPADLVLELLSRFTEQLARAEQRSTRQAPRGTGDQESL